MTLTPQVAQHLAYRFGLDFTTARRSPLLAQLVAVEVRITALTVVIRTGRARIRAYYRARVISSRADKLQWIEHEAAARATWRRAFTKRTRLKLEADNLKGRIARRLFE